MKKNLLTSFLSCSLLISALSVKAQSPTAPALGFNVFLLNDAQLITNETEGPVAMGGNLNINGTYQVSINNVGTFTVSGVHVSLVVGGHITFTSGALTIDQNGYAKVGDCTGSTMWYTDNNGAYSPMRITPGSDYNGSPRINFQVSSNTLGVSASVNPICQSGVIDFASAFVQMKASSTCMSGLTDNATLTNTSGTVIPHTGLPSQVKITLNSGTNVLNVTGSDLNNISNLTYNNSPDASHVLVINVNAAGSFTWQTPNCAGIGLSQCPYILWNFYNTTSLNVAGSSTVEGTIFAPYAGITKTSNSANVEGQVIAQSYIHGGGENHYANFTPTISGSSGCGTTPVATAASYTINTAVQCLSSNSYTFTNTSTGAAPFTYTWSFGDGTTSTVTSPVKSYTAAGTYNVKLVVNGGGGKDSVTHTVIVQTTPANGFTVNSSTQALTGNSFTFTSTPPTPGNTYVWNFGDSTTSTAINPVKSYTAAGNYLVGQTVTSSGGCSVYSSQYVVVTSDGVTGGSGGGLESSSLGDLVSKREYNRIKNSISNKPDYNNLPTFQPHALNVAAKGTGSTDILQRLVPASLDASTTPKITTPTDLTTLTYAVDAFSVDYTANNFAKAVVLAVTTEGKAYNHTKSICDRFRGAVLQNTSIVNIQGYNFIQFVLQQQNGEVEYCIAFAAGKSASSAAFNLQSKWLISEYTGDDSVFNFQVWSTLPANTVSLTNDILNNLKAIMPVQQTDVNFTLPPAYMSYGKRDKGFLDVAITSVRNSNNAKIIFLQRINELANQDTLEIPFNLVAGQTNHFSLPVYDGYEYEGHFFLDDTLTDDTYMADGNWSLDYDKTYTTVTNYKPNNNQNRVYVDGEYPIYRSVQVNASTSDYISIYKFITSGEDKVDLTDYRTFKFYAKGTGQVQVRLIKDSITKWADQYETTVTLDPNGKSYAISFDDFTSPVIKDAFKANDITAVVYTYIMNGVATDFSTTIDEQSFSPTAVQSLKALASKAVSIFPNPASSQFECKFVCDQDRDLTLTLTDITGHVIYKQSVHATMGANAVTVDLPQVAASMLLVRLGNNDVQYGVTKLNVFQ